jgi:flagellar basal body-associated protein FliL
LALAFVIALFPPSMAGATEAVASVMHADFEIVIDGDLSEWPDLPTHRIGNLVPFFGRTDLPFPLVASQDLDARFRIVYSDDDDLLYVAIEVVDERLQANGSHHRQVDAVELYVDGDHSRESLLNWFGYTAADVAALQYVVVPGPGSYSPPSHTSNPSLLWGDISQTRTQVAYRRRDSVTTYEWAVEAYDAFPGKPTDLVPGKRVGFDLAVVDKDAPQDNTAWVCWGPPGTLKHLNANLLGTLRLLATGETLVAIEGSVVDSNGQGLSVRIVAAHKDGDIWATGTTEPGGDFQLWVPEGGDYQVYTEAGAGPVSWSSKAPREVVIVQRRESLSGSWALFDPSYMTWIVIGALLAMAILHLFLYLSYPALNENLHYSLFALLAAVSEALRYVWEFGADTEATQLTFRWASELANMAMVLAGLRFLYGLAYERLPRRFFAFVFLAVVAGSGLHGLVEANMIFASLGLLEMGRVIFRLLRRQRRAWIIGIGFSCLALAGCYQLLMFFNVVQAQNEYTHVFGLLALMGSVSVYLARTFGRTNRDLSVQLEVVQRLSDEALERERREKKQEVQRRLLEADNERKTTELEEARQFQLSFLPVTSPDVAGLDIAFRMQTATEVGGDYCDFHVDGEGRLTVALGDATGHGMRSGMVVAVTKSLFCRPGSPTRLCPYPVSDGAGNQGTECTLRKHVSRAVKVRRFPCERFGSRHAATSDLPRRIPVCGGAHHGGNASGIIVAGQLPRVLHRPGTRGYPATLE